ncbi:MAG: hemerythrin domain-containing protein [Sulfuricurvum sp.]|nr:hemerythrin domain-containing protein [Sulfuricurvum sp.]
MATIQWSETYRLGIGSIDTQHQRLFKIIEKINVLDMQNPSLKNEVREIFYELSDYMKKHFYDEECHMRRIDFPELEHHQTMHHKMIHQVNELIASKLPLEMIQTKLKFAIKKTLIEHIIHEDMKIKRYQSHNRRPHHDDFVMELPQV